MVNPQGLEWASEEEVSCPAPQYYNLLFIGQQYVEGDTVHTLFIFSLKMRVTYNMRLKYENMNVLFFIQFVFLPPDPRFNVLP